jgi:hypothetical protein
MANTPEQAARPASKQDATPPASLSSSPISSVRFGNVSAGIFAEDVQTAAGKIATVYNISLRIGYRDKSGEWKHTHVLSDSDLLPAAEALRQCYHIIEERRRS